MEPIISPNIFYWANVLDSLQKIGILALIVSIVVIIVVGATILADLEWGVNEKTIRIGKKLIIIFAIVLVIAIMMMIFIPTKDTIYAMCVAEILTPDNIDAITEKGEKGVRFICEQIEQVINNTAQSTN